MDDDHLGHTVSIVKKCTWENFKCFPFFKAAGCSDVAFNILQKMQNVDNVISASIAYRITEEYRNNIYQRDGSFYKHWW